jgi:hypothetical protein
MDEKSQPGLSSGARKRGPMEQAQSDWHPAIRKVQFPLGGGFRVEGVELAIGNKKAAVR